MEKPISAKQYKNRKRVMKLFWVYLAGFIISNVIMVISITNFDNDSLKVALPLVMTAFLLGATITFWQRVYYRFRFGKFQTATDVPATDVPATDVPATDVVKTEPAVDDIADANSNVYPFEETKNPEEIQEKKERKGFRVFFALLGRSLQWLIMGFLFVTILNIIPVIPRGKRSMGNIILRFFAFAIMFPYSFIGLILMIFLWGKSRASLSASGNKIVDWYDYDQS